MLYKCDECGHDIAESARFCPNCGAENPWREWADSPNFVRGEDGKLVNIAGTEQPCHKCGKMLKPRSDRVRKQDPEKVTQHDNTNYDSAKEYKADEPLFYYWCPGCYKEALTEDERRKNEMPGCLRVFLIIGAIIGLVLLYKLVF